MNDTPSVYLAGPVQHVDDGGASWRDALERERGDVAWLNPLAKYNVPASDVSIVATDSDAADDDNTVTPTDIVEGDKNMLRNASGVLVGYTHRKQIGTPMEVMWAYNCYIPAVLWVRDDTPVSDMSPWYRYHTEEIHHDRDAAVEAIKRHAGAYTAPR